MILEILGSNCPKCKQLEENVKVAVNESGKSVDIIKITEMAKILEYGVMSIPAIVIDGEVKSYGVVTSIEEIKKWL